MDLQVMTLLGRVRDRLKSPIRSIKLINPLFIEVIQLIEDMHVDFIDLPHREQRLDQIYGFLVSY